MPTMYLAHDFQSRLEGHFVIVQWDRRGAGKSYKARHPSDSLTVRRTLADLYELTNYLRARFHQRQIYLVAHSWGTYLALLAVHEHPEWYRAYVGMGQLVPDTIAAHQAQRRCVVDAARQMRDSALVARLSARYGSDTASVRESDLFAAHSELYHAASFWPILWSGLRAPEYTLIDGYHVQRGAVYVGEHMRYDVNDTWMRTDPTVAVPVALFLGRHDCNTPSTLAAQYLATLRAPLKWLVWFDDAAHFPFWEQPDLFATSLIRFDSLVSSKP